MHGVGVWRCTRRVLRSALLLSASVLSRIRVKALHVAVVASSVTKAFIAVVASERSLACVDTDVGSECAVLVE